MTKPYWKNDKRPAQGGGSAMHNGPISEAVKRAMVADKALGMTNKAIAEKYRAHRNSVSRVCREVRETVPNSALSPVGWREDMAERAKKAVNKGLDCPDDAYKAGSLGATALKGLGEFDNGDRAGANVAVVFTMSMPADVVSALESFDIGTFPTMPPPPSDDDDPE